MIDPVILGGGKALHRDKAELEKNKASGFYEGTEIAVDQFVEHVIATK